jgi:hypothetical protein
MQEQLEEQVTRLKNIQAELLQKIHDLEAEIV